SSPSPATVKRSAIKYTTTVMTATIHNSSYRPRVTPVKEPANQMPRFCSISVCSATNVDTDPTTAPNINPTISTTSDDFNATRCRKAKNISVPTSEKTMATIIRNINDGCGTTTYVRISPRPAHSIVPVVDGSTNRFWVINCMISPATAIDAPDRISEIVRGTRVTKNMSRPPSELRSYTPINNDAVTRLRVTISPINSGQVRD